MLNRMQPVFEWVISEIKRVNDHRECETTISDDDTNEELINIFHDAANKFIDLDFDLIDDEETLTSFFGYDGYCAIREAEQGSY